jgi:hypothetical protein
LRFFVDPDNADFVLRVRLQHSENLCDHNYLSLFLRFVDQMRRKRLLNVRELRPKGGDFFSGYFVLGEEFIQRSLNEPAPLLSVDQLRADFTTGP